MSLDLKLLEKSLDEVLAKETRYSLKKWFVRNSQTKNIKKPQTN